MHEYILALAQANYTPDQIIGKLSELIQPTKSTSDLFGHRTEDLISQQTVEDVGGGAESSSDGDISKPVESPLNLPDSKVKDYFKKFRGVLGHDFIPDALDEMTNVPVAEVTARNEREKQYNYKTIKEADGNNRHQITKSSDGNPEWRLTLKEVDGQCQPDSLFVYLGNDKISDERYGVKISIDGTNKVIAGYYIVQRIENGDQQDDVFTEIINSTTTSNLDLQQYDASVYEAARAEYGKYINHRWIEENFAYFVIALFTDSYKNDPLVEGKHQEEGNGSNTDGSSEGTSPSVLAATETLPVKTSVDLIEADTINVAVLLLRDSLGLSEEEKAANTLFSELQLPAINSLFPETAKIELITNLEGKGTGYKISNGASKEIGDLIVDGVSRSIVFRPVSMAGKPPVVFEFPQTVDNTTDKTGKWYSVVRMTKGEREVIHKFGRDGAGKPVMQVATDPPISNIVKPEVIYTQETIALQKTNPAAKTTLVRLLNSDDVNLVAADNLASVRKYFEGLKDLISSYTNLYPKEILLELFASFLVSKKGYQDMYTLKRTLKNGTKVITEELIPNIALVRTALGTENSGVSAHKDLFDFMVDEKIREVPRAHGILRTGSGNCIGETLDIAIEFFTEFLPGEITLSGNAKVTNPNDIQMAMFEALKKNTGVQV